MRMRGLCGLTIGLALLGMTAPAAAQSLVLYSGRSKSLIEPLVKRFEQKSGIDVKVKYGRGAGLLQLLKQEARAGVDRADVFWANTAGTLGTATDMGLLQKLPKALLDKPGAFTPKSGQWVPVTTRFRVLAYNSNKVDPAELPDSVLDLPELDKFKGRIGWTPTYSSFQDFVTALRLKEGRSAAASWLQGMKQLDPQGYKSNTPMVRALAEGEIDIALTNHYYVHRLKHGGAEGEYEGHEEEEEEEHEEEEHERNAGAPVEIYHFAAGDPGNLALVTGAGMIKGSDSPEAARKFLAHLLSKKSQRFAAETVNEYPVIEKVKLPKRLLPMDQVLKLSPELEFDRLGELDKTLRLLREQGLF